MWKGVDFTKGRGGEGRGGLETQPRPGTPVTTFASLPVAAACDWQRMLQAALLRLLQGEDLRPARSRADISESESCSHTSGDLSTKPHHPAGLLPENLSGISSWLGPVSPRVPVPPDQQGQSNAHPQRFEMDRGAASF